MQALHKWAKDKPDIIKILAAQLISSVQDMSEYFKTLKLRRFASKKFPLPHLPSWFAMYRTHRKTIVQIEAIWAVACGKNMVQSFSEQLKNLKNTSPSASQPSKEEIRESKNWLQVIHSASEKELEDEFNHVPASQAAKRRLNKLFAEKPLEFGFFLFVAVPCWMLYRTSPTQLYRKARLGDFEALQNLLRLDQMMLHDPAIGKQIIAYRFNHSSSKYRKLLDAATKAPKGSGSFKNILLAVVGLLSAISLTTVRPLTPQDLFELVAAFDSDTKSKLLENLPKNPDALARALSPDRNLWRQVHPSDKKK